MEINNPWSKMLETKIVMGFEPNNANSKIIRLSNVVYPRREYVIIVKLTIARKFWTMIIFSLTKYLIFTSTCRLK